jgi:hypothetical protein
MRQHGKRSGHTGKESGSKYAVGYKRPPVATRFRPGGVGNPRGRPKKRKTVGQVFDEGFMRRIRVKKNGRCKTMTVLEHMIENLFEAGARGDMRAITTSFALLHRYKDSPETTVNTAELDEEDRKILEEYGAMPTTYGSEVDPNHGTTADDGTETTNSEPTGKPPSQAADSDGDAG